MKADLRHFLLTSFGESFPVAAQGAGLADAARNRVPPVHDAVRVTILRIDEAQCEEGYVCEPRWLCATRFICGRNFAHPKIIHYTRGRFHGGVPPTPAEENNISE